MPNYLFNVLTVMLHKSSIKDGPDQAEKLGPCRAIAQMCITFMPNYASAIMGNCFGHDLDLWPLTSKTFSAMPAHTNLCQKFHWNPPQWLKRYRVTRSGVNDKRTDGRKTGKRYASVTYYWRRHKNGQFLSHSPHSLPTWKPCIASALHVLCPRGCLLHSK